MIKITGGRRVNLAHEKTMTSVPAAYRRDGDALADLVAVPGK